MSEWITRATALERLGVKPQTLYAYVSRNQVTARPDPADPRRSLYHAHDIETLKVGRSRGRARAAVANGVMTWGEPSMTTAISTVHLGRLLYRGHDAAKLAETMSWEETAALLWESGQTVALQPVASQPDPFLALAGLVQDSYPSIGRSRERLLADAQQAISALACACGASMDKGPLHVRLAAGLGADRFAEPIRRALVLLADHELNASAFAVRVAASTGASIAACLLSGLTTLSGPRHGTAGSAAIQLLDEAERRGARATLVRYFGSGHALPGFGHPLYPSGDPRANALLQALPPDPVAEEVRVTALDSASARPNIDFALAVLARAGNLPENAPFRLFAVARGAGWVTQAIEQIDCGVLIRPRARYIGPLPE